MMETWTTGDWVFFGLVVLLIFCVCMAIAQSAYMGLNACLKEQSREINELQSRVRKLEKKLKKKKEDSEWEMK